MMVKEFAYYGDLTNAFLECRGKQYDEQLLAARREAFAIREELMQEASRDREGRLEAAREKVGRKGAEARERIRTLEEQGRAALDDEVESLGRAMAERVLGRGGAKA